MSRPADEWLRFEQAAQKCLGCGRYCLHGEALAETKAPVWVHLGCLSVVQTSTLPVTVTPRLTVRQAGREAQTAQQLQVDVEALRTFHDEHVCARCERITHLNAAHVCWDCWSNHLCET